MKYLFSLLFVSSSFLCFSQRELKCAAVVEKGKWKLIDTAGNTIAYWQEPLVHDYPGLKSYSEGMFLFTEHDKKGFKNWRNEMTSPAIFTNARPFHNGCAAVCAGNKWGVVNSTGKLIADTIYDYVSDADEYGTIVLEKDEKIAIIDTGSKIILPFYYQTDNKIFPPPVFTDGLLRVLVKQDKSPADARNHFMEPTPPPEGKIGFVDRKGKLVIDTIYELRGTLRDSHQDLQAALMSGKICGTGRGQIARSGAMQEHHYYLLGDYYRFEGGRCLVMKNYRSIVINTLGDSVFTIYYYCLKAKNTRGYFIVDAKNNWFGSMREPFFDTIGYGIYDPQGKIILPLRYHAIGPLSDGFFKVSLTGNFAVNMEGDAKEGLIRFADTTGKFSIKDTFDMAYDFSGGFALVEKYPPTKTSYGNINRKGKLFSVEKDKLYPLGTGDYQWEIVKLNDKWGYADNDLHWKIKPQYEECQPFSDNHAAVKLNGKWGYIDKKGKMIITPRFDHAEPFQIIKIN